MQVYSLMYHDVVRPGARDASGFRSPDANTYKLDADVFEDHLAAITDAAQLAGFVRAPRLRELMRYRPAARPAVLLHFDDGGACALDVADRLERAGWHGYFHITTDLIGTRGFVTVSDIRELDARGHVIGSHTMSHPGRMSSLRWDAMVREWWVSKAILDDLLGKPVVVASVPGGYCSRQVVKTAAQAGIEFLFTSEPTSRFVWFRGCIVLGRYAIRRSTRAEEAASLATGALGPCLEQWVTWNAKKVAKGIGGEHWLTMRKHLLGWYAQRAGAWSQITRPPERARAVPAWRQSERSDTQPTARPGAAATAAPGSRSDRRWATRRA
jgi:peptidoglycan/xylan/chitin deacetylase (PgdA/CDA1 family)